VGDLTAARTGGVRVAALLLLALAFVRIASVVFAEPMVGFANQYDMHRTSACIGLWPEDVPIAQATPEAPRAIYRRFAPDRAACYASSQVAIAGLALMLDATADALRGGDPERMSLRVVGATGLAVWAIAALLLAWSLWPRPALLLGHGIASLVLVADPVNTLYLNTLYTEFPALLALYFGAAVVVSLWVSPEDARLRLIALATCLLALGFSRVQHLALPFVLAGFAWLALWRARLPTRWPALGLLACCTLVIAVQSLQQRGFEGIARANIADTVLGAAMPAGDPDVIAARLSLPPRCAALAYSTWYRQHGVDVFAECPELAEVSRLRLLIATLREPAVFARMLLRGLAMSQNARLGYLGERADGAYVAVDSDDSPLWASLASAQNAVSPRQFLWLSTGLLGVVAMFWAVLLRDRAAIAAMEADSLLIALGAHGFALTLLSSVFGDGYSEVARHLHLGINAGWAALALVPVWIWRRRDRRAWRGRLLPGVIAGAWMIVAALLVARLPIAFGVLGTPSGAIDGNAAIELRGWALDIAPLSRLVARVDGHDVVDLERTVHPRLAVVFPSLPDAAHGGFAGTLPASALDDAGFLEIVAIDARGHDVVIERRRVHHPAR
jgi:hypothetical protein